MSTPSTASTAAGEQAADPVEGLGQFRSELDVLDHTLIEVLGRRIEIGRKVGHYKAEHDIPVMQHGRVDQVLDRNATAGAAVGLDPTFVKRLYQLIIDEMCRVEDEIVAAANPRRSS